MRPTIEDFDRHVTVARGGDDEVLRDSGGKMRRPDASHSRRFKKSKSTYPDLPGQEALRRERRKGFLLLRQ
jgi:hypothetical protein